MKKNKKSLFKIINNLCNMSEIAVRLIQQLQREISKPKKSSCDASTQTEDYNLFDIMKQSYNMALSDCKNLQMKHDPTTPEGIKKRVTTTTLDQGKPCKRPRVETPEKSLESTPNQTSSLVSDTLSEESSVVYIEDNMYEQVVYEQPYLSPSFEEETENKMFEADTKVINRKGNMYLVEFGKQGCRNGQGMFFHDTIKKEKETWQDAEDRHREAYHPIIQKRAKLLGLLAKQNGTTMNDTMVKYASTTTIELFCKVKQESPELIKQFASPAQGHIQ